MKYILHELLNHLKTCITLLYACKSGPAKYITMHVVKNNSTRFSRYSEAFASEYLEENLEELSPC